MPTPLIEITGFAEFQEKLKKIGDDKTKRAAMFAVLRAVASGTVKAARDRAPIAKRVHIISGKRTRRVVQPGNLKKSIGIIVGKKGGAKINPTLYVGPRARGKNDGFYGGWVEEGHEIKSTFSGYASARGRSSRRSRTTPKPFMKPAYDQTQGQVTAEAENKVTAAIQKQITKLGL